MTLFYVHRLCSLKLNDILVIYLNCELSLCDSRYGSIKGFFEYINETYDSVARWRVVYSRETLSTAIETICFSKVVTLASVECEHIWSRGQGSQGRILSRSQVCFQFL